MVAIMHYTIAMSNGFSDSFSGGRGDRSNDKLSSTLGRKSQVCERALRQGGGAMRSVRYLTASACWRGYAAKADALTENDMTYRRGSTKSADGHLSTQQDEIAFQMEQGFRGR